MQCFLAESLAALFGNTALERQEIEERKAKIAATKHAELTAERKLTSERESSGDAGSDPRSAAETSQQQQASLPSELLEPTPFELKLKEVFDGMDTDGNGVLDKRELCAALLTLGQVHSHGLHSWGLYSSGRHSYDLHVDGILITALLMPGQGEAAVEALLAGIGEAELSFEAFCKQMREAGVSTPFQRGCVVQYGAVFV